MAFNLSKIYEEEEEKKRKQQQQIMDQNYYTDSNGFYLRRDANPMKLHEAVKQGQSQLNEKAKEIEEARLAKEKEANKNIIDHIIDFGGGVLATGTDLALDLLEGGLRHAEGGIDTLAYLGADALDIVGAGDLASDLRSRADFNSTAQIFGKNPNVQQNFGNWTQGIEEASWSPDFVDQIAQGIGQIGTAGLTAATTGGGSLASAGLTFASSYGNARSEAKRNGASDADAHRAGLIGGFAETISEQFFSGIPGMKVEGWGDKLTGKIADKVTKYFGTKTGKIALKAMDSLGEGSEEIISNILNAALTDIGHAINNEYTYGMENMSGNILEDTWDQLWSSDSWGQFLSAALSSAIVNGGKAVFDTKTQNKIINAYAQDNNMSFQDAKYILTGQLDTAKKVLTDREKVDYDSQVELEDMAKQRVLNYMQQTTGKNAEANINEQIELEEQNLGIKFTDEQKQQMAKDIRSQYEDSINNPERYRSFTQETDNEKKQNVAKSMADMGLDDSKANHRLYDFISTLIDANPNSNYRFVNGQTLAEMGLLEEKDGKYGKTIIENGLPVFKNVTIQGLNSGNEILINTDLLQQVDKNGQYKYQSDEDVFNLYSKIIGHEMGEAIKNQSLQNKTDDYNNLKALVKEFFGEGDLNEYKQLYGENLTTDVEDEYVNDKLGELFKNDKLIEKLADNRNVLQKFIDEVKRLLKYNFSSKEKKQLMDLQEKLMNKFVEKYKEASFTGDKAAFKIENNQNNGNNTELESSFNLPKYSLGEKNTHKQQQLDLVLKNNPMTDDYHQGIRSIDDIKTFEEAINDDESFVWGDYTREDAERDLARNKVKVYSSYDIKNGTFVSTSYQQALEYAGRDASKVHSKEVNPNDVAWINGDEGQYAKVDNVKYSLTQDSQGRELSKEQQEYFKDSKVRTPDGSLRVMYRGGKETFNVFDRSKANPGGQQGNGFYFTTSKDHAMQYGNAKEYYLNITNPLTYTFNTQNEVKNNQYQKQISKEQLRTLIEEMANNEDYSMENYGQDMTIDKLVDDIYSKDTDYDMLSDLNMTAVGNMAEFLEYVNDTLGTNYDGIITDYETVVLNSNQIKNVDNTNPTSNPDIRYSLSTKDSEGRDLSVQQQQFFKDSKVRDDDGNLLEVYHGTNNNFNTFRSEYNEYYFTDDKNAAADYGGNIRQEYLNLTNPYIVDFEGRNDKANDLYENGIFDVIDYAKENGYDGVIAKNTFDGANTHTQYVAFKPNQIKNINNANPTLNNDTRYSLSVEQANTGTDNSGNQLSKEQQEYFKNSKVTDESGNLIEVYHTTTDYTNQFNEFNPVGTPGYRYGDTAVNFYTDSKDMSSSYGYNSISPSTTRIETMEDVNKVLGDRYRVEEKDGKYELYDNYEEKIVDNYNKFIKLFNKEQQDILTRTFNKSRSDLLNELSKEEFEFYDRTRRLFQNMLYVQDFSGILYNKVNRTFDEVIADYLENGKVSPYKTFNNQNDLFRNVTSATSPYEHYQYNGYLNITNPYIVEGNGKNWNDILQGDNPKAKNMYELLTDDEKTEMTKLANLTNEMYDNFEDKHAAFYQRLLATNEQLYDKVTEDSSIREKLYTTALNNWDERNIEELLSKRNTTNDLVKQVLEMNENGANYDGVIFNNITDYGWHSAGMDETQANNVYVTFNSNQFKAADNFNPSQDSDIRYSLTEENYTRDELDAIKKQLPRFAGMTKEQLGIEYGYASDSYAEMIKLANDLQKEYKEFQKTPEFMDALQNYKFDSEVWKKGDNYADKIRYYNKEAQKYFAQREAINSLLMDSEQDTRSAKQIVKDAEKHFGTTNDFKETAYITTNGKQLDFSGSHEGGQKGSRSLDHRQINEIDTDMDSFISMGNIRVLPESGGINLAIEPNTKQYSMLRDYIEYAKQNNDEIYVDVDTENGTYDSARYNKNTPTSTIINDIKQYFATGQFPQKSEYADFYYSLSKDQQSNNNLPYLLNKKIDNYKGFVDSINKYNLPTETKVEQQPEKEETYGTLTEEDYKNKKRELIDKYVDRAASKIEEQVKEVARRNLALKNKDIADLRNIIGAYYEMSREDIYSSDAKDVLRQFVEDHSHQEYEEQLINDEIRDMQKDIRAREFIISSDYKEEFPDGLTKFKKNNPGINIKFGAKGNLDTQLQELADLYPGQIDANVTYGDIPYVLADLMKKEYKQTKMQEFNLNEEEIDNITNKMFYGLTNNAISDQDLDRYVTDIQDKIRNKYARQMAIKNYRQEAKEMLDEIGLSNIKDKKRGLLYQVNTMKRNLRDIMNKESADKMYNTYFKPISIHNAQIENDLNNYYDRIDKYHINNEESTYAQMLGELKYNPVTTLTEQFVNDYLTKNRNKIDVSKVESAIEETRAVYDELMPRINEALIANGYKPIEYRQGYFPHFIEDKAGSVIGKFAEKLGFKVDKGQLPTDIAGITEEFVPGKAWTSFSQQRTGDATDYNLLKGLDNYLRGAMDIIYHTQDIQKLRALEAQMRYEYTDKGVREKIDEIFNNQELSNEEKYAQAALIVDNQKNNPLGNLVTELRNYTNSLANKKSISDRGMEQTMGRDMYSIMNNISSRVSANMVGANISSAMTNFIPITQAWSQVKTKNMLKAIYATIKSNIRDDGFSDNSIYLTNRTKQADRLFKTKLDKATQKLGIPFEAIDSFTSNVIVRAKYYENLENGMNEVVAMDNADEFAKDVMAGRSKGDSPTMFNKKNPITKLFTAFQLEVNNQYGYMFKDIKADIGKEAKDKIAMAFLKMFLGAFIYNQITEKITGRKAAFSPIDMAIDEAKIITNDNMDLATKLQNIAKDVAEEAPFLGGVLGGGRLPIQGAIPYGDPLSMITSTWENIGALADDEKRDAAINSLKKEWLKPVYYVALPVAGGQIKKTNEGLAMYNHELPGSYTDSGKLRFEADTSPLGKLQAAVFGQYASGNAREYFAEGYTPLSEKQVDEAMEANLPITEYREVKKGLTKATKVAKKEGTSQAEAKVDYIYNLPLNDDQKNVLVNNALNRKEDIDISNYGDYSSLEEFDYANKNPQKYDTIRQVANYNVYNVYKDNIQKIKQEHAYTSTRRKAVEDYINSLPLNYYQKLILQKEAAGYSIEKYEVELYNYINGLDISAKEKKNIHKELFG